MWIWVFKFDNLAIIGIEISKDTRQLINDLEETVPLFFPNIACIHWKERLYLAGRDVQAIASILLTFVELFFDF